MTGMTTTNEHGQPVGEPVPAWEPRPQPAPEVHEGRYVRLEPLAATHAEALFGALGGEENADLWTYRGDRVPMSVADTARAVAHGAAATDHLTFAVVPVEDPPGQRVAGTAQGLTSLLRVDPQNGAIEVGSILYARSLQRTPAATEATYLLARHVLDDLGYRRLEWKCDSLNEPSRRAAERLGFTYEGRHRQAVVVHGRNRDTDWYSILDREWPALRGRLEAWLDPGNFGPDGRQRRTLEQV